MATLTLLVCVLPAYCAVTVQVPTGTQPDEYAPLALVVVVLLVAMTPPDMVIATLESAAPAELVTVPLMIPEVASKKFAVVLAPAATVMSLVDLPQPDFVTVTE